MNKLLVIIPAYNECESIKKTIEGIQSLNSICDYVIINDGSKDSTRDVLIQNNLNYIDLPVNLGLSAAFRTGMKYAYKNAYKYAMQFDADGQHGSEYISGMLDLAEKEGSDIVIGSRYIKGKNQKHSLRTFGGKIISICTKITTGKKIYDVTSGMRLYSQRIIKLFALNENYTPEPDTIAYLSKCGAKIEEFPVEMKERMFGKSYLGKIKSIKYMYNVCVSLLIIQWFRKIRGVL